MLTCCLPTGYHCCVQRRLKRRRRSAYEAHCEVLTRRQRRHEEIDKYMSEIQQKQRTAKMASDSWLIAVVLETVVYQVSREHTESAEQ